MVMMEEVEGQQFSPKNGNDEFVINPETGKIVEGGHEYANTQRMKEVIRRGRKIKSSLSPVKEDYIRLWRGNRPGEVGENPSFTSSLEGIALAFLDGYGGELTYVDIPKTDLKKYGRSWVENEAEFILSAELAKTARIVEDKNRPNPKEEKIDVDKGKTEEESNNPSGWKSI